MYNNTPLKTKWAKANKKKYQAKGYIFTFYGDDLEVAYDDALSHATIEVVCDYCGKTIFQQLKTYVNNKDRSTIKRDACENCWHLKMKETMILKYGVDNASNNLDSVEKRNKTFLGIYKTENSPKLKEITEKTRKTNLERYGYEHSTQIPGEANRRIELACQTMYKRGNGACSYQQKYIHDIVGGELNYPVKTLKLDIAFPDKMVYIEYEGSGHNLQVVLGNKTAEEFAKIERNRYYVLKNKGWKMIRIISSKDRLPTKKQLHYYILMAFGKFKYYGHNYFEINIDNMTYTYAGIINNFGFNKTTKCNNYKN